MGRVGLDTGKDSVGRYLDLCVSWILYFSCFSPFLVLHFTFPNHFFFVRIVEGHYSVGSSLGRMVTLFCARIHSRI